MDHADSETLIGTAIATAVLPTLAEYFSIGKMEDMRKQIERAGQVMLALTIPIAIIASVVIQPVVQGFLGFTSEQSNMVAQVTRIFLVGIIGHSLVELFVRSFYAQQSPKYPLIGAFGTLIVYLALGIGLMPIYKANGIAAANTIACAAGNIPSHYAKPKIGKTGDTHPIFYSRDSRRNNRRRSCLFIIEFYARD